MEQLIAEWTMDELIAMGLPLDSKYDWAIQLLLEHGYKIVELNPTNSIVANRAAFLFDAGFRFTFTENDDPTIQHGFIYSKIIRGEDKIICFKKITKE